VYLYVYIDYTLSGLQNSSIFSPGARFSAKNFVNFVIMILPGITEDEELRLEALHTLGILDTQQEDDYEDIVKLASAICQTPISLVSLIDSQRQWFKARIGLDLNETVRDISFCAHAIQDDDIMVVPNVLEDERFYDNPLVVNDPNIRFYAGMPLKTRAGFKVGTLCVIDRTPRNLTHDQVFALQTLGKQVMNLLELRINNARLQKLNSLQNKMLAIVSHDVRNPLITVQSLIRMVEDGQLSRNEFNTVTEQLQNQVGLTLDLLNNLIEWGVSQMRGENFTVQGFGLHMLVEEEFVKTRNMAHAKGLWLKNNVHQSMVIKADINMLRFMLRNMITNAIKFTDKGGISVSCNETECGWNVNITDTGVGIPPERQVKLLNRQDRYTTAGTRNEAGSGMGLVMCFEFAEKHNGEITINSEPGKGSTFTISLNTR